MTPDRWRRVTEVFHAALESGPEGRGALLDEACAGDPALRAEVDAMLTAHRDAGSFGERPSVTASAVEAPRLDRGATLGPYRIQGLAGAGGMGEVYRARDERLGRDVAIKVLPAHVAHDAHLRQRLEREAKALAALSHPHICPVFDVGQQDGVDYLVMEYLEGETLARRLEKGALPLRQALQWAIEIASALDAAHRRGLVHRDLKPGNVMLTKGGARLLDFGLARQSRSLVKAVTADQAAPSTALTWEGSIVGTLQYMAPEQLNGGDADSRSDIFAFGAVLYEMVTGKKAFEGQSQASVIAAILEHEPTPVSAIQPATPSTLDHLIQACLAKDPEERWQSAHDLKHELAWIAGASGQVSGVASHAARRQGLSRSRAVLVALAVGSGVVAGVAAWRLVPKPRPDPLIVSRFDYQIPDGQEFRSADRTVLAFSPDGSQFVYNTQAGLYLRSLGEADARPIAGTEGDLSNPFFSPDGQWIAYFSAGQLKKISASGGTPITLCEAEAPFGASWGADARILFGQRRGIVRVSEDGGAPELIVPARPGERLYGPELLPGGKWLLVTTAAEESPLGQPDHVDSAALGRWDQASIVAQSLGSSERRLLWKGGSDGRYSPSGHLVFAVGDALHALAFDAKRLAVSGRPVGVINGVQRPVKRGGVIATGAASYGFSAQGTLVYVQREEGMQDRLPALVDHEGRVRRLDVAPGPYVNPRVSPDGRWLVVQTLGDDGRGDIWVYDLSGKSRIRQLTTGGNSRYPLWTADSQRVTFVSDRDGVPSIYWQLADGTALAERLTEAAKGTRLRPDAWSPDGRTLVYRVYEEEDAAIWTLNPAEREPHLFHRTPRANVYEASLSPDGRWLAYTSTETGQDEIHVMAFPGRVPAVRVTQDGGCFPIWSPDGKQLIYRRSYQAQLSRSRGAQLFSVPIMTQRGIEIGAERTLPIEGFLVFNTYRDFDITGDGRFALIYPASSALRRPRIHIVQNWFEELKARVPVS